MREVYRIVDEMGHFFKLGTLVERVGPRNEFHLLSCRADLWRATPSVDDPKGWQGWPSSIARDHVDGLSGCGHGHTQALQDRNIEPFSLVDFQDLVAIEAYLQHSTPDPQ